MHDSVCGGTVQWYLWYQNKAGASEEEMQQQQEIFRLLMAHRDLICLCPVRKSGIKISADANSVTLPTPLPQ